MKKKVAVLFMAVLIAAVLLPSAAIAASFSDTDGHWAEEAITTWTDNGVLFGYPDGTFAPDNNIIRGEFSSIIAKALGYETESNAVFSDLSNQWYRQNILRMVAAGAMAGYGDGRIGGDDLATREQAMVMFAQAFNVTQDASAISSFPDADKVSDWAKGQVGGLIAGGYVVGDDNGMLNPQDNISRAEVVMILHKLFTAKTLIHTHNNDGVSQITDSSLDQYFKEDTALEGVEALLNTGNVYVNGFQVPVTEETTEFEVNGFISFWETDTGWTNSVHKSQDADNMTFEESRLRFVQGLSSMAGLTVELYCEDGSGYATRIETTIKESVLVDKIMVSGETTTIDRSNFELAIKPGMPDINDTTFLTKNVDPELNEGDIALYWEADDGWHLERAVSIQGKLTGGQDHGWYEFNNTEYPDSGITKYCLAKANRPGQFLGARQILELTNIEVTMWCTETGYPIGFTSGDNAVAALTPAIQNAESAKVGVTTSMNGSDVSVGKKWVTAEAMDAFNTAISAAQAALDDASATNADLDRAIYDLSLAYTDFIGAMKEGTNSEYTGLKAGAGVGVIDLEGFVVAGDPDRPSAEYFSGEINDAPHARVLLLESTEKVAIVSVELIQLPAEVVESCKEIVSSLTGTPKDNVWIHATHALSTPHANRGTETQKEFWVNALTSAVTSAAEEAVAAFKPAKMGVGTGQLDINQNWNLYVEETDSYTYGPDGDGEYGESNKTMTVLRVDSLDNEPIGFLLSYGIKPNALDMGGASTETRVITSDVPGYACSMMETEFGAPTMFCTPGAADQMMEMAYYYKIGENGLPELVDEGTEAGLEYVEKYGTLLGNAAIEIAKGISPDMTDPEVAVVSSSFEWDSANPGEKATGSVDIIKLGNLAFVGFKEEMTALTELELWDQSPFDHTLLVTFLNGDNKYMPNEKAYDDNSYETTRTFWAKGAAEKFVETAVEILNDLMG